MQICGSSPPYELDDDEEMSKNVLVSHEQSGLSSSPVVVSSKKGIPDTFKK